MKQIILLVTALALVATSCQKEKQVSNTVTFRSLCRFIISGSIDSVQIAGGAI
jgi:hypothetical protein